MDSEDVREDKDDEREKEKPLVGDLNDGYEYIAYDDTGCQEGIKEKKAPSPLLDFGEECEVESQKLQDDRIGGEKDAAKTEKEDSASSSSEDEAENVKNPIPGNVASDSDSEVEQEEKKERKASSCYSSSDEEGAAEERQRGSGYPLSGWQVIQSPGIFSVADLIFIFRICKDKFVESEGEDKESLKEAINWYRKGFEVANFISSGLTLK